MVQADLGEVTGAQASIYERAAVAVEHALPLLDMLKPLRPDADDESTESVRAIVRSSLTELVSELGQRRRAERFSASTNTSRGCWASRSSTSRSSGRQNSWTLFRDPKSVDGTLGQLRDPFRLQTRAGPHRRR